MTNAGMPIEATGEDSVGSNDKDDEEKLDSDPVREELDENAKEEALEKLRREREARAQALTLEIVGDLPFAEVKPPENVLFVCKLNPVTEGQVILHRWHFYRRRLTRTLQTRI